MPSGGGDGGFVEKDVGDAVVCGIEEGGLTSAVAVDQAEAGQMPGADRPRDVGAAAGIADGVTDSGGGSDVVGGAVEQAAHFSVEFYALRMVTPSAPGQEAPGMHTLESKLKATQISIAALFHGNEAHRQKLY